MTPREEIVRGTILGVAFALIAIVSSKCSDSRWQAKTDAALQAAEDARHQADINAALASAAQQRALVATVVMRAAQDSARRAIADADRLRAQRRAVVPVASNPAAPPTVSDTARALEAALALADTETVVLRAAIEYDRNALAASERAQAEIAGALALERASVATLTTNLQRVERQLASADPPCRLLFWGCPSRTTVFVLGAGIGTALTITLTR